MTAKRIDIAAIAAIVGTVYPPPFDQPCRTRRRQKLGDAAGLTQFGVNLLVLPPGAWSSQRHWHTEQDEFVYVLEGHPTLVSDDGTAELCPGMCAGFPAKGPAHHLENRTGREVVVLEVGDRAGGDQVSFPLDDLATVTGPDGKRRFTHKDGTPY